MIPAFVIQHIDAIITTAAGLIACIVAFRKREQFRSNSNRFARGLPILAPLVLIFGLLQFVMDSRPAYSWQRFSTNDEHASAEFPIAPTREEATDHAGALSVHRIEMICNVPKRDINLRLSYNQIPPEGAGLTTSQRLEGMTAFFEQQGFKITTFTNETVGEIPIYRIVADKNSGEVRQMLRIAIQNNAIYRALATSTRGFHDDPVIMRFVDSFRFQ
jgi:hypothetical protein